MSITADELLKALAALEGFNDEELYSESLAWDELSSNLQGPYVRTDDPTAPRGYTYERGPAPVFDFGTVKVIEDFGGEGQGETRYIVIEVTDSAGATQFFRKDGYYSSYDGSDWDGDFREVKAQPRTVVFYE